MLGSLVRAAEACRDVALAYDMPFISGKDSLNNEFHVRRPPHRHPADAAHQRPGPRARRAPLRDDGPEGAGQSALFLVGATQRRDGRLALQPGQRDRARSAAAGGPGAGAALFGRLHEAIQRGLVRSCHDLSEGGLAVAVAEMAFAGGIGADLTQLRTAGGFALFPDEVFLFSESTTRFVVEVTPANAASLTRCLEGVPCERIGQTCKEPRLRIAGVNGEWIIWANSRT